MLMNKKKLFLVLLVSLLLIIPAVSAKQNDTTSTTTISVEDIDVKQKTKDIYEKVKQSDIQATFFGTEYSEGEPATIWLQLLRSYQPLNNATCYITAYFPTNHSVFLNSVIMNYLAGSDGLYYYDLTAPDTLGVYMLSAKCNLPEQAFIDDFLDYSKLEEYENVTITDGKIVLYPYVGAWTALDSSGNGRHGTLTNMESSDWVVGKLNGALLFDGVNEYVDLENIANFDKEQSFSVESWVKTTSNKTQNIISRRDTQPNIERGWEFQMKNGKLKFTVSRSITNTYWVSQESLLSINDGNWHHAVATWTGVTGSWGYPSNIKLYIDGQLADSYPSGNVVGWSIMNDAHCQISGKIFDTYNVFDGVIDEVVVYTKVLSLPEVQFRYNNGTGTENMIEDVSSFVYGWWHLNPVIGATSGYIKSSLISLNGISWLDYFSDYVLNDGSIDFKILDSSDNVLCSSLGDISGCAGTASLIRLYARLTKPYLNSTSPEIDRWWVRWLMPTIEEIRGAGEMRVSTSSSNDDLMAMMLALHSTPVTNQTCDGNHLVTYKSADWTVKGKYYPIEKIETELCLWGCDAQLNACKDAPYKTMLLVGGGIVAFILVVAFLLWLGGVL